MPLPLYRNRKSGRVYALIAEACDCTNSRDGTPVVIYTYLEPEHRRLFVRERAEFLQKFELIGPPG